MTILTVNTPKTLPGMDFFLAVSAHGGFAEYLHQCNDSDT